MDDQLNTTPEQDPGIQGEPIMPGPGDPTPGQDPGMQGEPMMPGPGDPTTEAGEASKRNWLLIGIIAVIALIALLAALGVFKGTPEAFITITEPGQGANLPVPEAVTIQGQAGGLIENSVVVQALDESGNVLAEQTTAVNATEPGGSGNWSIDLVIPVKPGSKGSILVFSTSPEDGSTIASAGMQVTYGAVATTTSQITILDPSEGATLDLSKPVTVKGTGEGLFEGNVVVQALDEAGQVIVEDATTMPSAEVGGPGEWSINITVEVTPGTKGTIRAFSPSPADGSVMAEDQVAVIYGEQEPVEATPTEATPPEGTPTEVPPTEVSPTEVPPESALLGQTWTLELILPVISQPVAGIAQDLEESLEDTTVILVFKEDGVLEGNGGCNSFTGRYEVSSLVEIEISDITATRKTCDEPDGIMTQESHFFDLLKIVERFYVLQHNDEQLLEIVEQYELELEDEELLVLVEVREDENDLEQPLFVFKGE